MANGKADIYLLFGVQGGGTLDNNSSGKAIKKSLLEIANKINQDPIKIKFTVDPDSINKIKSQLKEAFGNLGDILAPKKNSSSKPTMLNDDIAALKQALTQLEAGRHQMEMAMQKAQGFDGLSGTKAIVEDLNTIKQSYQDFSNTLEDDNLSKSAFAERLKTIGLEAKKSKNQLDEFIASQKNEQKASKVIIKDSTQYAKATEQVNKSLETVIAAEIKYNNNKRANKSGHVEDLKKYEDELHNLNDSLQKGTLTQDKYNNEINKLQLNIRTSTDLLEMYKSPIDSLRSSISQVTKEFIGFYSTRQLIAKGVSVVKDMVNQAIELESAFADTRIVTHATQEELQKYADTVMTTASQIGTSVNSLVSATTTYARLGYDLDESSILAKYTGMLERVGNIDTQKAEDAVTAILKAFPDEADVKSVERIMDMLVQTGNNAPISVSQIAEGMTNASSALAAARNDFKESVALLTAANTTVQNASKSSTALRTISARIRKTKSELDELGETMEESTYENLVNGLTKHNVMLTDINGEYRSTYDIMKDISAHWSEMTNMEQAAMAEAIAGNRQQTVFYSLVENFGEAEKAMEGMVGSAGALEESYGIYLDTTAAHIEQFKTSWQALSKDFINSDTTKKIVDIGTAILGVADKLAKAKMLLPSIIAMVSATKIAKLAASVLKIKSAADQVSSSLIKQKTVTTSLETQFKSLSTAEKLQAISALQSAKGTQAAGAQMTLAELQAKGLVTEEMILEAENYSLGTSFKALMATNPLGWIGLLISGATALAGMFNKWSDELDEFKDEMIDVSEVSEHMKQTASDFRNISDQANELIPRYVRLANGVDVLGRNVKLSDEEYKEFIDTQNKLADIFPDLKTGIDENGNAMLDMTKRSDELTSSLERQLEVQRQIANQKIIDDMSKISQAIQTGEATGYSGLSREEERRANALQRMVNFRIEMARQINDAIKTMNDPNGVLNHEQIDAMTILSKDENFGKQFYDKLMAQRKMVMSGNTTGASALQSEINGQLNAWVESAKSSMANDRTFSAILSPMKQGLSAWAQLRPEYDMIPEDIRGIVNAMISAADPSVFAGKTEDDWKKWVQDSILEPLNNLEPEAQDAISKFVEVKSSFIAGDLSASDYTQSLQALTEALKATGVSGETATAILNALGAPDMNNKIESLRSEIEGAREEVDEFVDGLNGNDVELAYSIIAQNGSMTIDELKVKMEEARDAAVAAGEEVSKAFNVTDFFDGLKDAANNIDSITSAMQKLSKGTALTTKEMVKLAEEFPELLTQSNLFTDGSIEGQKAMLQAMLNTSKKEYDAQVDTNIAKLKNELEAVKAQILLEQEKARLRTEIVKKANSGIIDLDTKYVYEVSKLNALEANNFVNMENDKVDVNEAAMNSLNSATNTILQHTIEDGWNEYAKGIDIAIGASLSSAVNKTARAAYATADILRELVDELGRTTSDIYNDPDIPDIVKENIRKASVYHVKYFDFDHLVHDRSFTDIISTNGYSGSTWQLTGGQDIQSWYNQQSANSAEIMQNLEETAQKIQNEINNLEGMKRALSQSLTDILQSSSDASGGSSGSSSGESSSASKKLQDNNEFKEWYTRANHDLAMGTLDQATYIAELQKRLAEAVNNGLLTEEESFKYLEEIKKAIDKFEADAKDTIDKLAEYRVSTLKDEANREKEILNKRISNLKTFYDKQKELLRDQQSEEQYADDQAEKRNKVSNIRRRLSEIKYDTSASAVQKRRELESELATAEKELRSFEQDHSYDLAEKLLDSEYERQEAQIQSVIDTIDKSLNDPTMLYNIALNDIRTNSEKIFSEMKEYGSKNGNGRTNDAVDAWNAAAEALEQLKRYWSLSGSNDQNGGVDGVKTLTPYASGSANATPGLHRIDENGRYETIFKSASGNRYRLFSGGEKVLNADASDFLFKFAASKGGSMADIVRQRQVLDNRAWSNDVNGVTIQTGDIIVNGSADDRTLSEIRRAQRENVEMILKEFSKLKR